MRRAGLCAARPLLVTQRIAASRAMHSVSIRGAQGRGATLIAARDARATERCATALVRQNHGSLSYRMHRDGSRQRGSFHTAGGCVRVYGRRDH